MRAILVSVDFSDLLQITLPYNAHHFEEVWVVTSPEDAQTQHVAKEHGAEIFCTDAFWRDGADFNKWLALEEGLDAMGREGWLCLMDADVLWPRHIKVSEGVCLCHELPELGLRERVFEKPVHFGFLCTPLRRMMTSFTVPFIAKDIPPESEWDKFPVHRNVNEWAGYSQVFHASDPVLGTPPWHQTDWVHAGGADSFFQMKWPRERKIRPPFEVLHIGEAGINWCGRAGRRMDGSYHEQSGARAIKTRQYIRSRRRLGNKIDYSNERLS